MIKRKSSSITGLALIILVASAAGCVPSVPNNFSATRTQTIPLTSTPTLSIATRTPETNLQVNEECVEIVPSLDLTPDETLVLQDQISNNIALFDLKTDQSQSFGEAVYIMAISPDRSQLAYTDKVTGKLIILASNGKRLSTTSVPDNWIGVIQWISPSTLLMDKFLGIPPGIPYGLASTIMYNTKTGEVQEFASNYPGITTSIPPFPWDNYSYTRTVYDPLFSRVIYPAEEQDGHSLLVLLDLETKRDVTRFHTPIGSAPQWTQDGSYFVTVIVPQFKWGDNLYQNVSDDLPYNGGHELFWVSRDGKVQRLTYLTTKFQAGEEGISLSPNEEHIAFWLNLRYEPGDLNADRKLAVLDISTGEITNLCLAGTATPISPIWSPDGKYLVISRYYTTGDLLSDVLLVDLEHGIAKRIAKNSVAKGWLVK